MPHRSSSDSSGSTHSRVGCPTETQSCFRLKLFLNLDSVRWGTCISRWHSSLSSDSRSFRSGCFVVFALPLCSSCAPCRFTLNSSPRSLSAHFCCLPIDPRAPPPPLPPAPLTTPRSTHHSPLPSVRSSSPHCALICWVEQARQRRHVNPRPLQLIRKTKCALTPNTALQS